MQEIGPLIRVGSRGAIAAIAPLKPTKVTLFTMTLYNLEKEHWHYEATLRSTVLSQQRCEVYFISLAVVNPQ